MDPISKKRKISESAEEKSPEMRTEFIRLISQALHDLGYVKSAQQLEQESGIQYENPDVKVFREAMLSGNWDLVADIVPSFKIPSKNEQQIKLCVKQQKYLEFIAEGDFKQALSTLRNEVTPVHDESKQLHFLASLLLSQNTEELKENIELECDRKKILKKVQNYIPASIMIPSSRLLVLTGQALEYQINTCEKHCGFFKADTLLEDHSCESFSLPDKPVNTITESMEVWNCVFSHSGDKLLVICKNICISIWEIPNCQKSLGVNIEVTAANWTVNDKQIVIGVIVGEIKIFDLNGCLINVLTGHDDQVTGVQFLQPGLLLSGGVDRRLILWEEGVKIKVIEQRVRQIEKAVNSNVVAVLNASKNEVTVFKFMPLEKVINIVEDDSITSIQVNMNGTQIITVVSMTSPKINLWSISGNLLQTYDGFVQEKFILKPCFVGPTEDLVAIGSENGKILIWAKIHGSLLGWVTGHSSCVNCLVINPKNPSTVVSCSDDCTIKLWNLDPADRVY